MTGWDGFAKYIGVQGILAIILTIALVTILIMGIPVTTELLALVTLTYGFYFAKNGYQIVKSGIVQLPKSEDQ